MRTKWMLALIALTGCLRLSDAPNERDRTGETCFGDDECGALKCVDYACVAQDFCNDADDCRGDDQGCAGHVCVAADCTDDTSCGGFRCLDRVCTTECEANSDCAHLNYCSEQATCEMGECVDYNDCDAGFACDNLRCVPGCHAGSQDECGGYDCNYDNVCLERCTGDYDCVDGYDCKLEKCVPRN